LAGKFPISFSCKLEDASVHRKVAGNDVLEIVSQHTELVLTLGVRFHPHKHALCVCGTGHCQAEKDALVDCAKKEIAVKSVSKERLLKNYNLFEYTPLGVLCKWMG